MRARVLTAVTSRAGVARLITVGVEFDGPSCCDRTPASGALSTPAARGPRVPRDAEVVGHVTVDPGVTSSTGVVLALLTTQRERPAGHVPVPFPLVVPRPPVSATGAG